MKTQPHSPSPALAPIAVLTFNPEGIGTGLYTEAIDLHCIGRLEMCRASRVEFNEGTQKWDVFEADKSAYPASLYSHPSRSACLAWEREYFNAGQQVEKVIIPAAPAP